MYNNLKDQLDNFLSIPLDASEDIVPSRRKNKRRSLFNYLKFKEDNGYPVIMHDSDDEEKLSDSTDGESCDSGSAKSVSQFYERPKNMLSMKGILKPNYLKTIDQVKMEVMKKFTEGTVCPPVKLNLSSTDFFPKSFGFNCFGNVYGMYHQQMYHP
jgi:hypothetical protein